MSTVQILTPTEIRNYESPPRFDSFTRKKFFVLPIDLMKEVRTLRTSSGKIAGGIKSGAVNFTASHKYRSLEDYLIPLAEWETDSAILPEKAELGHRQNFAEVQSELSQITHQTFLEVNQKLENNLWFKPKTADDWTISTPPVEKSEISGLKHYFPTRQMVALGEVFSTVNQAANFLEEFTHWQNSSKLKRPSNRSFWFEPQIVF